MLELAERVAETAQKLGIDTAMIGAMAMAAHNYVRGTSDVDFATYVDPFEELAALQAALEALGLRTKLNLPDEEDVLGGLLRVWQTEDDDGDPIDPVEVVNFRNPLRLLRNPGAAAVRLATAVDASSALRYARLPELIALKLYAGGRGDEADVVELLHRNPSVDVDEIRRVCEGYGFGTTFDELLAESRA